MNNSFVSLLRLELTGLPVTFLLFLLKSWKLNTQVIKTWIKAYEYLLRWKSFIQGNMSHQ